MLPVVVKSAFNNEDVAVHKLHLNQNEKKMNVSKIRKQISIFLPVADWRTLRLEAARQGVPITELCRQWICPEIASLQSTIKEQEFKQSLQR